MARVYGTKSTEEALQHLLHVSKSNANDPFTLHAIGIQFHALKLYRDALKYFERAEAIKAGITSSNLFYIGDCLRRTGAIQESLEYYKKALSVPVHNRVDLKGYLKARKHLSSQGLSEAELDAMTPQKPSM
ncbi:Tetratricopeptide repeat-containing protein [Aphelenchoides fujianensis]|nr:Tetratricopeptide repeat-containing protein [Aphelenchoides fujianensis]